jgi:hypothetical protein
MHDISLLRVRIEEILNRYDDMPIIEMTKDSFVEEISQEIALFMDEGDKPKDIASVINGIDFRKWELE